jgi:hypothetical protein
MVGEVMAKSDADGKHAKKRTQQERARDREDSTAFASQGEGSFTRQRGVEKEGTKRESLELRGGLWNAVI